ncbi:metal ABC transporter solute-binding protein, Zn/Mn family [Apilactobacillus apinorum]|uniref:metal ABC transporter solute-binding protein, Zn/Mn family n=1 Tax=Apilactobacillus apinorum TaxID=1218495 RepID=UPI0006B62F2D|nr:zinc ABC transporter substrate-binding protein [Apilactobacillus apinorum]KOY68172.1 ABC-type metal ion transport system, periplasmic component [Apilactobacillus apinorum]CAI2693294.1 ABC-type metal ion transport system, periplasmic component [Apilactobacillus apinorum]
MKKIKAISLIVFIATFILILTGCSASKNDAKKSIHVTSSVNFYGEVAKNVLGKYGKVTSIINNPNIDPHDFNPASSDAKSVYQANLVIYNGLGYDSWAQKLLSSNKNVDSINVGSLMGKKTGDNPHIWYNVATMEKLANELAAKFTKLQPSHKKDFENNAKAYIAKLKVLNTQLADIKKNKINKTVAVSEPVFDYSLTNMGYTVSDKSFEEATEKDNDPSPKSIREIQNDIKDHKLAFFVYNKQVNSKTVTNLVKLAKQNNVPVVSVTETKPSDEPTYITWMQNQYKEIQAIQNKK